MGKFKRLLEDNGGLCCWRPAGKGTPCVALLGDSPPKEYSFLVTGVMELCKRCAGVRSAWRMGELMPCLRRCNMGVLPVRFCKPKGKRTRQLEVRLFATTVRDTHGSNFFCNVSFGKREIEFVVKGDNVTGAILRYGDFSESFRRLRRHALIDGPNLVESEVNVRDSGDGENSAQNDDVQVSARDELVLVFVGQKVLHDGPGLSQWG